MKLYPYQIKVIKDLYKQLKISRRALLIAPTGSGKTVLSSEAIRAAYRAGRVCWFIVHREELVNQTVATFKEFDLPSHDIAVIKDGYEFDLGKPIQVVSVQTLGARKIYPPDDAVIFWDEAHTTIFFQISQEILARHRGFKVAVTATPWRASRKEGFGEYFPEYVMAPAPKDLIEMGFLTPMRLFGFSAFNLKGVKRYQGDFAKGELERACNTKQSNKTIVTETLRLMGNRKGIIFATSIQHAEDLAELFNRHDVKTEVVKGSTKLEERARIYDDLREGKTRLIASVGVLTEGFDEKSIDIAIIARPTKSKALYVQMCGRVLRVFPGKRDAMVLDFAECFKDYGDVSAITQEQMKPDWPDPIEGEAPVRACPKCFEVSPIQQPACPGCGYEFPVQKKDEKKQLQGQLIEVNQEDLTKASEKRAWFYGQVLRECFEKGWNPDTAKRAYFKKFRRNASKLERYRAAFDGDEKKKRAFWVYLKAQQIKHKKSDSWAETFFRYEFGVLKWD